MTTKQLVKKIHNYFSSTFILGNAILSNKYEHILNGVFVDKTPSSVHVYRFIYPLFDTRTELHLLYSQRIGSVPLTKDILIRKSENEVLEQVLAIVRENENVFSQLMTLKNFCAYLDSAPGVLNNGYGMYIYAMTNCLLGKGNVARKYLNLALPNLHANNVKACETAISLLDSSLSKLVEFLIKEETNFKRLHLGN